MIFGNQPTFRTVIGVYIRRRVRAAPSRVPSVPHSANIVHPYFISKFLYYRKPKLTSANLPLRGTLLRHARDLESSFPGWASWR